MIGQCSTDSTEASSFPHSFQFSFFLVTPSVCEFKGDWHLPPTIKWKLSGDKDSQGHVFPRQRWILVPSLNINIFQKVMENTKITDMLIIYLHLEPAVEWWAWLFPNLLLSFVLISHFPDANKHSWGRRKMPWLHSSIPCKHSALFSGPCYYLNFWLKLLSEVLSYEDVFEQANPDQSVLTQRHSKQALLNEIKCLYSQAGRAESSTTCISECQARYRLKLKAVIANLNGELT